MKAEADDTVLPNLKCCALIRLLLLKTITNTIKRYHLGENWATSCNF